MTKRRENVWIWWRLRAIGQSGANLRPIPPKWCLRTSEISVKKCLMVSAPNQQKTRMNRVKVEANTCWWKRGDVSTCQTKCSMQCWTSRDNVLDADKSKQSLISAWEHESWLVEGLWPGLAVAKWLLISFLECVTMTIYVGRTELLQTFMTANVCLTSLHRFLQFPEATCICACREDLQPYLTAAHCRMHACMHACIDKTSPTLLHTPTHRT